MIWIIGGTKDSRDILEKILIKNENQKIVVTTATEYGGKLLEDYKDKIEIISERLDEEAMKNLIIENNINLVIDASHPYAQNVSKSVINVVNKINNEINIKYIRFERKMLDYGTENVEKFDSLEKMNNFIKQQNNKNILSTLGSNNLADIKEMSQNNNLYVRILPTTDSIKKAEELGYLPKNIIAIQGPVDKNLNKAMLESFKIDYLITKESGATGGEKEKVEACQENGVTVLVLTRPFVDYGIVFNEIDELIEKL